MHHSTIQSCKNLKLLKLFQCDRQGSNLCCNLSCTSILHFEYWQHIINKLTTQQLKTIRIDLYHVAAVFIFSHSNQRNQTEAGRRKSLVPFCTVNICIHYCYWIQGKWPRQWQHDSLLQMLIHTICIYITLLHRDHRGLNMTQHRHYNIMPFVYVRQNFHRPTSIPITP